MLVGRMLRKNHQRLRFSHWRGMRGEKLELMPDAMQRTIIQQWLSMDVFIGLLIGLKVVLVSLFWYLILVVRNLERTLPKYDRDEDSKSLGYGYQPQVSLVMLRESLAMIVCYFRNPVVMECCNIWVMRKYGMADSWSKQHSIGPITSIYRCLGIVNNRDLMLHTYVAARERNLLSGICVMNGVISHEQEYKTLGLLRIRMIWLLSVRV
ncbi:hypothetical protein ACOSQ2_005599 [Xanthoceras sorbifolium]